MFVSNPDCLHVQGFKLKFVHTGSEEKKTWCFFLVALDPSHFLYLQDDSEDIAWLNI